MAPEMLSLLSYNSQRVDIYSLGCILYFLMTGQETFNGFLLSSFSASIENLETISIPDIYSDALRQLMIKCLSGDPYKRPSIDEILSHQLFKKKSFQE